MSNYSTVIIRYTLLITMYTVLAHKEKKMTGDTVTHHHKYSNNNYVVRSTVTLLLLVVPTNRLPPVLQYNDNYVICARG